VAGVVVAEEQKDGTAPLAVAPDPPLLARPRDREALRRKLDDPRLARVRLGARTTGRSLTLAGKKRPKSVAQTEKKPPAKRKRPKKTSRGK